MEIEKIASSAQLEADEAADSAIDLHEQLDGVLVRKSSQQNEAQQMIHTAKAERRAREKLEREGGFVPPEEDSMSAAEKRALDAERRAQWRKARLKSLENVSRKICSLAVLADNQHFFRLNATGKCQPCYSVLH